MNWDVIEGKWDQFKGGLRSKFAKLTDDDWENVKGKRDVFVGKLQERYGYKKDEADQALDDYLRQQPPH